MTTPTHTHNLDVEFVGQLHNRAALQATLGLPGSTGLDTETLLRTAWQRWGTGLAEHLVGDFALAVRDGVQRLTYLARNPLGVKPLYYRIDARQLSYGFSIPELRQRCALPVTKDIDWAATYLLNLSFSQTETAYKEILKLPPGHWLSADGTGHVEIRRYHHWHDNAPVATRRNPRWVEAYREVLEEAIRCRMDPNGPMGAENSGGIDSATIAAYLAEFLGEPGDRLHSFGFALCDEEPAFILETSRVKRIRHNYIITDRYGPQSEEGRVKRGLAALGYPEEHVNSTGHIPFYEECRRRDIRTLFSGFGGDEVVTNHGGHLRWELLDGGHYRALWDILPGNPLLRTLRLLKAATIGRRRPTHNPNFLAAWNLRWPHQLLRPEVVQRLGLYERYMETAIYDAPYRRTNDLVLQYHLHRMQLTARLENCTVMAAAYGVDYRWPLWDTRLVQQYLSTPAIEKVGPGGIGRYLHRRAIDKVVPARVAWKPTKDMGSGPRFQEMINTGTITVAAQARGLEANLHPLLEELVDRAKFHQQIALASRGQVEINFAVTFKRNVNALLWLNNWLHGN